MHPRKQTEAPTCRFQELQTVAPSVRTHRRYASDLGVLHGFILNLAI